MTKPNKETQNIVEKRIQALGGIEQYLQGLGVDDEIIEKNKHEHACKSNKVMCCYDTHEYDKYKLVPVSKIKGITRPEQSFSWFDLLQYSATGAPHNVNTQTVNLSKDSILEALSWVELNGLEALPEMYENMSNVGFVCYEIGNKKEYYQITNGNHRVIAAKNLGLEFIRGQVQTFHKFNWQKYEEYRRYQRKKEYMISLAEKINVSFEKYFYSIIAITFEDGKRKGDIWQFSFLERDLENNFFDIYKLEHEVDEATKVLENIKNGYKFYRDICRFFPGTIGKIIEKIVPNVLETERDFKMAIALKKAKENR